ncbi:hypothetical protein [Streptomyces mesophilus]|uniref:hypothetical protein n=1 Tax=Streptomyces mesophilus TaxID=1775132 RepID=UPI00332A5F3F
MRRTITCLLTAACLALVGCSSSGNGKADSKPRATPKADTPMYTFEHCKSLLEQDYEHGLREDRSVAPECAELTDDEYAKAVGEVLGGHKGDFLDAAADQAIYDAAWETLEAKSRAELCDLMDTAGPEAVGILLEESMTDPSVDTTAMAEYLHAEKC